MKKLIPVFQPTITSLELDYVTDAVKSGWISSLGKYIDIFEKNFANYCQTKYAVSTSSGTTALHLALLAHGIKSGDEVIIPDLTFVATANAVSYIGAKVISVDVDENSLCISPESIERAITPKTKAIIPVHLYGHPAKMHEINKIAKKYDIFVVEDAAEAHGAELNGIKIGGLGDAGVFSFYGNKNITTGEGGIVTTNNKHLYERMCFLRDHAMSSNKRYWHTEVGFNYRMTNLQAALGVAQLERIDSILAKKKDVFDWYFSNLSKVHGVKLNYQEANARNVYWTVCLEVIGFKEKDRDCLIDNLKIRNIDSRPFFYLISDLPMYEKSFNPSASKIYQRGINLPSYFDITKEQVDYICNQIVELLQ